MRLSIETDDSNRYLKLSVGKGDCAEWAFEFTSKNKLLNDESGLKSGFAGYRFRLLATAGKFQRWYVGVEEYTPDQLDRAKKGEAVYRPLKLVEDQKSAVEFRYDEARYWIFHRN